MMQCMNNVVTICVLCVHTTLPTSIQYSHCLWGRGDTYVNFVVGLGGCDGGNLPWRCNPVLSLTLYQKWCKKREKWWTCCYTFVIHCFQHQKSHVAIEQVSVRFVPWKHFCCIMWPGPLVLSNWRGCFLTLQSIWLFAYVFLSHGALGSQGHCDVDEMRQPDTQKHHSLLCWHELVSRGLPDC